MDNNSPARHPHSPDHTPKGAGHTSSHNHQNLAKATADAVIVVPDTQVRETSKTSEDIAENSEFMFEPPVTERCEQCAEFAKYLSSENVPKQNDEEDMI